MQALFAFSVFEVYLLFFPCFFGRAAYICVYACCGCFDVSYLLREIVRSILKYHRCICRVGQFKAYLFTFILVADIRYIPPGIFAAY